MNKETLITIDAFRITQRPWNSSSVYIEHYCNGEYTGRGPGWLVHACDTRASQHPCCFCKEKPADGIQAMFWFLKEGS
jgi:hypothetical protein